MRYHFSGIAGAGVNPLARLMRARGHEVQGSDRSFDQGKSAEVADELRRLGIGIVPQDGAAVTGAIDRFVYSTAVEAETPEMRAARAAVIPRVPRPALLAEVVNGGVPGIAVSGTSGKSTITGMIAWLAREAGLSATIVGGAGLVGERGGLLVAGPAGGPWWPRRASRTAPSSDTGRPSASSTTSRAITPSCRRSARSSPGSPASAGGCS